VRGKAGQLSLEGLLEALSITVSRFLPGGDRNAPQSGIIAVLKGI
jgi:hypothetical protein